jgi:hypothetical protein
MDLAWDAPFSVPEAKNPAVFSHLTRWATREFGARNAQAVTSVMKEYYRLANIRKPEFMKWNSVERQYASKNSPASAKEIEYNPSSDEWQRRIDDYLAVERRVDAIKRHIPDHRQSAFYEMVEYPVKGASLINQKWLCKQMSDVCLSRGNTADAKLFADKSRNAFRATDSLTQHYNALENGKWEGIMDCRPRKLPVFAEPEFPQLDSLAAGKSIDTVRTIPSLPSPSFVAAQNASDAVNRGAEGVEGLGHSFAAVPMRQGDSLVFTFHIPAQGEYHIKIATLPNHDVDGKGTKFALSADGKFICEFDCSVRGTSEAWKQNVLRGQALSSVDHYFATVGEISISVKALTSFVIFDQIMLWKGETVCYEFPVKKKND